MIGQLSSQRGDWHKIAAGGLDLGHPFGRDFPVLETGSRGVDQGIGADDLLYGQADGDMILGGVGDDILQKIEDYNRDDVVSTLMLHRWLEERRDALDVGR